MERSIFTPDRAHYQSALTKAATLLSFEQRLRTNRALMHQDDYHHFCQHPLLADLFSHDLADLGKIARVKSFPPKTQVLRAGEKCHTVHLILNGSVKLLALRNTPIEGSEDGELGNAVDDESPVLVSVLNPGDFMGITSALSGQEQTVNALTAELTRVASFSAENFSLALKKYPPISHNLNLRLTDMMQQMIGHIVALSTLDVPGRLAFQLLRFAYQKDQSLSDSETLVTARLTQNDLAQLCGASREQVNRILKNWQRQNLISAQGKNFIIHQPKTLKRLAR